MRILVVAQAFLPVVGGVEMCVHHLSWHWRQMGHEVLVVNMSSDAPVHPEANYGVKRLRPLRGGDRFGWHRFPWRQWTQLQLRHIIRSFQPDGISAHLAYPSGVWLSGVQPRVPWSVTCHGIDVQVLEAYGYGDRLRFALDRVLANTFRQATGVIVLSEAMRGTMQALGAPASAIIRLRNGADRRLADYRVPLDVRARMQLPPGADYVLSIGRHHQVKGFEVGLKAFAKVASEFPNIYYVLIGKETSQLHRMAETYGIADRVRTCEQLEGPDLWAVFQRTWLYVAPSRVEGMPLVGCQAVMAGLPLLATACDGHREVVTAWENGLMCPVDHVSAMAEGLRMLLGNHALRHRLAQGSRKRRDLVATSMVTTSSRRCI
ncbi:hypothetical protein C2W62_22870 [Candidatus Entotheonella serta]|nr:hypothetical protein C2W62_22870 [Candidatus Entotheonella serta]